MDGLILSESEKKQTLEVVNKITENFGLSLSEEAMVSLQRERMETLKKTGRVEVGNGILPKLIHAFCDSPYVNQSSYEETLSDLQELFYFYKNECNDLVSDDELIEALSLIYNDVARGDTGFIGDIPRETMYTVAVTGTIENTELEMPSLDEEFYADD